MDDIVNIQSLADSRANTQTEYVVFEAMDTGAKFPCGSVVTADNVRVLYRDIDFKKHVFSPRGTSYQAIAVDDVVVRYFETYDAISQVWFRDKDRGVTYKAEFEVYKQTTPKKMRGRKQRFVSVGAFVIDRTQPKIPRPKQEIYIPTKTGN